MSVILTFDFLSFFPCSLLDISSLYSTEESDQFDESSLCLLKEMLQYEEISHMTTNKQGETPWDIFGRAFESTNDEPSNRYIEEAMDELWKKKVDISSNVILTAIFNSKYGTFEYYETSTE